METKNIIANNIATLRKSMKWTQLELAEKLNYSDKAVSKWERAEVVPDIFVLKKLSALFNVSLDFLTSENNNPEETIINNDKKINIKNKLSISLMAAGVVWLIAVIVYCIYRFILPDSEYAWLSFIYAIPIVFIVLIVFNSIWGKRIINFLLITFLTWSIALAFYLTLTIENKYLMFVMPVPFQIIIIIWYLMKGKNKK